MVGTKPTVLLSLFKLFEMLDISVEDETVLIAASGH
jgi:hypothetical protein